MLKRYAIWDKTSDVYTPDGKLWTAAEWMEKWPIARLPGVVVVCAAGEINGGFFGTLGQMVQMYGGMGADFSGAETGEEKLAVIEAFEDARNAAAANAVSLEEREVAALEALVLQGMDDM